MRLYGSFAVILASMALFGPTSVVAQQGEKGFELCNHTGQTVTYAKALNVVGTEERARGKAQRINTEGWFDIAPGSCDIVWPGALKYRYYMIYAEAVGSSQNWAGNVPVCVRDGRFKITNNGTCEGNKNQRMFVEVDTGDLLSYTYDLR